LLGPKANGGTIRANRFTSKTIKINGDLGLYKKIYAKMMFFDVFLELIRLDFDGF